MKEKQHTLARRGFLAGAGIVAAATGAAVLTRPAAPVQDGRQAAPNEADGKTGYRLSDHIRKYYKSTLV